MPMTTARLSAAEVPIGATLMILADPVQVAPAELGTFADAVPGQSLRPGDVIRTGRFSMAANRSSALIRSSRSNRRTTRPRRESRCFKLAASPSTA
jgi:hypothetical protein